MSRRKRLGFVGHLRVQINTPHDTKPQSVPYERCEYHRIFGDSVAVKFYLNGENRAHLAEMIGLIEEKLEAWRSQ